MSDEASERYRRFLECPMPDELEQYKMAFAIHGWECNPDIQLMTCTGCDNFQCFDDITDITESHRDYCNSRGIQCRFLGHYEQNSEDNDLDSARPALQPRRDHLVSGGRYGANYDPMPGNDSGLLQHIGAAVGGRNLDADGASSYPENRAGVNITGWLQQNASVVHPGGNLEEDGIELHSDRSSGSSTDSRSALKCLICLDNYRDQLLLPCRHVVVCTGCLTELEQWNCPLCKNVIMDTKPLTFQREHPTKCSMCCIQDANIMGLPCGTLLWCEECFHKHGPQKCSECRALCPQHVKVIIS